MKCKTSRRKVSPHPAAEKPRFEPSWAQYLIDAVTIPGVISKAYHAFHGFSVGNQMLAWAQCVERNITPGPLATFLGWKDKARSVRKGQKALWLCMPVLVKDKESPDPEAKKRIFIFRPNWFTVQQTEGEELPASLDLPEWSETRALQTLDIVRKPFDLLDGNTQGYAVDRSVAINPCATRPMKTLFHELAHVVLGHTTEGVLPDNDRTPKNIREVEAESVAHVLCNILEVDGIEESRGYIQHWLCDNGITDKSAHGVLVAADKILRAGQPPRVALA